MRQVMPQKRKISCFSFHPAISQTFTDSMLAAGCPSTLLGNELTLETGKNYHPPNCSFFGQRGGGFMKRIVMCLFVALVVSAMTCASLWAQATAQISGTVRDQSGAVLPGVEVTATHTETAIS